MKNERLLFAIISFVLLSTSYPRSSMAQDNNARPGQQNVFEQFYGQRLESVMKASQNALLYIDSEIADGKIPEALINLGYTVTVADDWPDFTDKLNTGDYDLAVGFNQGSGWGTWKAGLLTALQAYLAGGGAVVFNDWTGDNDFAALFETSFTGITNQTIMHLAASIEDGLPNPITLQNPGWGTFSTGLTATGDAEAVATFDNGDDAIVKGNDGRSIILGYLTDTPPEAYRQQLFENLFQEVTSSAPEPVPFSNWTLYLTFSLIMLFAIFRFSKMA